MGLRFQRRVRLFPGVSLNLGKSGVSVSVGGRGHSVNYSRRGTYGTVGIPGTGISFRQKLDSSHPTSRSGAQLRIVVLGLLAALLTCGMLFQS
jgi:hypothetical protein